MRKYLFGTGIISAVTSGMALLRGALIADDSPVHGKEQKLLKKRIRA